MTALESDIIAEGFRSGVNQEVMEFAKSEIRVSCGGVCIGSCVVSSHSEKNGALINEAIHCPSVPHRLSGQGCDMNHFFATPSASRGGSKT